jgi:hypothetical protein
MRKCGPLRGVIHDGYCDSLPRGLAERVDSRLHKYISDAYVCRVGNVPMQSSST